MPQIHKTTISYKKPFPSEETESFYQSDDKQVRFQKINLPAYDNGAYILTDIEDNVLVIASCHEHIVFHVEDEKQLKEVWNLQQALIGLVVNQLKAIDKHFAAKKENVRSKCERHKDQYTLKVKGKYLFLSISADSHSYNLSFKELDIKAEYTSRQDIIVLHGSLYPRSAKNGELRIKKYKESVDNAHFKLHSLLSETARFVSAMKHKFNITSLEK